MNTASKTRESTLSRDRIVVIGASAGGIHALRTLAAGWPAHFPAPICIVLHIGIHDSRLPELLTQAGSLTAQHAEDGASLSAGRIYVAPPDHHLLIDGRVLRLNRGAKEHHTRPAIDPLFRSAALSFGPRAIGVILTGRLDDGTAGLQAIKHCGGIAIVQDPNEAEEPSMPSSACRHVDVDHVLTLEEIPEACAALVAMVAGGDRPRAPEISHEFDVFLSRGNPMEHLNSIGNPSTFVCPDCRGTLWQISNSQPKRFRCHTGHAYTLRTLEYAQTLATNEALWTAIRGFQEREFLLRQLAAESQSAREIEALQDSAAASHARAEALKHVESAQADVSSHRRA